MKVTKHNDHYIFENEKGEYHLSLSEYNVLGRRKAIELATAEIDKKSTATITTGGSIDFKKARELGLCEWGILDFCEQLNLDMSKTYKLEDISKKLTTKVILRYPDEIKKLLGHNCLDSFGGVKQFLSSKKTEKALIFVLDELFIDVKTLHRLACEFAMDLLPNFETLYPNDLRPRQAIEAKLKWLDGLLTDEDLAKAESAALLAAKSAWLDWSAAYSVPMTGPQSILRREEKSAVRSAAESAQSASRAAESAARTTKISAAAAASEAAAWGSDRLDVIERFCDKVLMVL